jgi:gliding motility-associated-like protein
MLFMDNTATDSTDNVTSWTWAFGDNSTGTGNPVSHYYDSANSWIVDLAVQTQHGCRDTVTDTARVYTTPIVSFDSSPYSGCEPLTVDFSNATQPNSGLDYQWYFGDGDTSQLKTPTHTYDQPGQYDVVLTTQGTGNCRAADTVSNMVSVYETPLADFVADPQVTSLKEATIDFSDQSSDNVSSWYWQFGTGDSASVANPAYTYEDTGTFPVTLQVTTDKGCVDTIQDEIIIQPEVSLYVPNAFSPNGDNQNDEFRPIGFVEGMQDYELKIWNRWGEIIFQTTEYEEAWNGRKHNTQKPVQNGVYVFFLRFTDASGNEHTKRGYVFVTR